MSAARAWTCVRHCCNDLAVHYFGVCSILVRTHHSCNRHCKVPLWWSVNKRSLKAFRTDILPLTFMSVPCRLLKLLDGIAAKVNLIVFNPHEGTKFLPSEDETVLAFRSVLVKGGRVCTIRNSRGDDEMAACGQLGDVGLSWKPAPTIEPPPKFRAIIEEQQRRLQEERQTLVRTSTTPAGTAVATLQ